MKTSTVLLILIVLMHLVTLTNITFFNGDWNGLALWLNTGLFIAAIAFYSMGKTKNKKPVS
ncbi:hypothetical protein [Paenisporosarcina sp. TG-14]|uniref:hypothetical protein n=1 Tax=Paenisporosarcina sp. TG-14 TaxID=1231057 RepID=UPI000308E626|nr:hypothetical protein [Paenisporosarcina sp. TG-14]